MTKNKYIFIGLILIILCVFIFLGYIYYYSRPEGRGSHKAATSSSHNPIAGNQEAKTQKPLSHSETTISSPHTKTMASIVDKQDYQPTETEKLFYHAVIDSLKPKSIIKKVGKTITYEDGDSDVMWDINKEIYKAFSPREPLYPGGNKQYEDSASHSKQYYQKMIMNLQELIKQCPDSPYHPLYQETFNLIIQMQKEDELFYDKYDVGGVTNEVLGSGNDVHYRGTVLSPSTVPLDERITGYIHCLRYSYFYKSNERYTLEFGDDIMGPLVSPSQDSLLPGAKLVNAGVSAVPAILNILEDRRPIIAVDDEIERIPARFYRYQDAAVEILQRMFIKAKQPFPIQLPEDQYFSGYLEKQTPEMKQKIINDIKVWVEESMKNTPETQQPPESPK
jgi:hypothetical protein